MKIVVISPTYNEKANIKRMIPVLEEEVFPTVKNHTLELLIVDDHSPDGTADQVREYMKKWKNIKLLEGEKAGLGAAYVRGMKYAMEHLQADAVIEFDSDFQHDPHDIPRLISAMDEGYDYVIGSRYIPGGQIPKEWGMDRKFLSFFGSLFTRIVWLNFRIHDMTSGYKLTKTSFLRKVDLDHLLSKQFAYKMHILHDVVKLGAKVKEIPIVFYERKEGASKISKKDQIDSLKVVLQLRWRDSERLFKFLGVGGTGFLIQLIIQEGTIGTGITRFFAPPVTATFTLLNLAHDPSIVADAIGGGFGAEAAILSNFLLNNFWTFSDTKHIKERGSFWKRLISFNVASLLSIIIQAVAVGLGEAVFGKKMLFLGLMLKTRILILFPTIILIVIPLNYIIYNKLIWKTQYLKHAKATTA